MSAKQNWLKSDTKQNWLKSKTKKRNLADDLMIPEVKEVMGTPLWKFIHKLQNPQIWTIEMKTMCRKITKSVQQYMGVLVCL